MKMFYAFNCSRNIRAFVRRGWIFLLGWRCWPVNPPDLGVCIATVPVHAAKSLDQAAPGRDIGYQQSCRDVHPGFQHLGGYDYLAFCWNIAEQFSGPFLVVRPAVALLSLTGCSAIVLALGLRAGATALASRGILCRAWRGF